MEKIIGKIDSGLRIVAVFMLLIICGTIIVTCHYYEKVKDKIIEFIEDLFLLLNL